MTATWSAHDGSPSRSHHLESFWRIPPLRNLMDLVTARLNDSYMARVKDAIETRGR